MKSRRPQRRPQLIQAVADERHASNGVAVVGSYQMSPQTDRPFKARGISNTAKTQRLVELSLTREEAQKLVDDWVNMGELKPVTIG